jgi:FAD dependent oxidoreductase
VPKSAKNKKSCIVLDNLLQNPVSTMPNPPRIYDLIVYGDEVPGVLALVSAAREYKRQTNTTLKTLLLIKSSAQLGIGGHLVRGGLAYLDRSNPPADLRSASKMATFGYPVAIYQEFIQQSGVVEIALDAKKANLALRKMLSEVGADILSQVSVTQADLANDRLTQITLTNGELYAAKQFIDCTVNGELAQAAGISRYSGFGTFGLPDAELPVTLVIETQGLTPKRLREIELTYIQRLTNVNDAEAQRYLSIAAGGEMARMNQLRSSLLEIGGRPKTLYMGTDHIDIRCRALSIFYHALRGKRMDLDRGMLFDQANIATFPDGRMCWNALMFPVTGPQANAIAKTGNQPTPEMREEVPFLDRWFRSIGATSVTAMPELYVRHAGNVRGVVESISGADMMNGGIPEGEAIGTFAYHLDVRGGIPGLGNLASGKGIGSISFNYPPVFNIGIRHAVLKKVRNLAVVSPASGFEGYACGSGRIVEYNVGVGQGVGIAAAIAIRRNRAIADVGNWEVRDILESTGKLTQIYGYAHPTESKRLYDFEVATRLPDDQGTIV